MSTGPNVRIDIYRSQNKNERDINLLKDGITLLNLMSAKGQEFDTVFLLESEKLLLNFSDENKRKLYMVFSRARDQLFIFYKGNHIPDKVKKFLPNKELLRQP